MKVQLASLFLPVLFIVIGCVHAGNREITGQGEDVSDFHYDSQRISQLQNDLMKLANTVDPEEARLVAEEAILYSRKLANRYLLVHPPLLHNIFVNLGIRDRGLCIHWTEDLFGHLIDLQLKTYEVHWGIAHHHNLFWRDHSSVIITLAGEPFEKGIVLDPWRHSGELFWVPVNEDTYPWRSSDALTWQ
jgi:hypothetical protein